MCYFETLGIRIWGKVVDISFRSASVRRPSLPSRLPQFVLPTWWCLPSLWRHRRQTWRLSSSRCHSNNDNRTSLLFPLLTSFCRHLPLQRRRRHPIMSELRRRRSSSCKRLSRKKDPVRQDWEFQWKWLQVNYLKWCFNIQLNIETETIQQHIERNCLNNL